MENTTKKKKGSALKYLAVVAFLSVVILISWFSVQLVNNMPGAFSSLASLAENIKQYPSSQETNQTSEVEEALITVTSNKDLINSGDLVNISWGTTKTPGSYTFYYECDNGIALDIVNPDQDSRIIGCGKNYNIGNTDSLTLQVESERVRFEDVNYTVAFLGTNDTSPRASGTASFTVINSEIPDEFTNFIKDETEEVVIAQVEETKENQTGEEVEEVIIAQAEETEDEQNEETETGIVLGEETHAEEATTDTGQTETEIAPTYVQEFTYEIPTSDPNGKTDLSTKFVATGNILSNIFVPGSIFEGKDGAIQFEVKNYGTKTSSGWTFSISLPNDGEYVSQEQAPLKPNERALLTIGFAGSEKSKHTFVVEIDEATDKNSANDGFSETVFFAN